MIFGVLFMVKGSRKKKVIALLVSDLMDPFSIQLARGVSRAASKFGVDMLIFPGKYIDRDLSEQVELMYDYQFTTLFTYANSDNIDGLIISANSIGCHSTEERMREFVDSYGDIPSVLVATHFEGYTCVCYDNKNAVKEGISHLIKQEGCRHICLISGPEYNTDVIERKRAYVETLEENGLEFNESMCEAGDFEKSERSADAMEKLLRANPDMDAVFCLNDNMAMSAYDVLRKHGLTPGEDVKVFGYDNVQASGTMDPPLATVGADPIFLGERSVECLLEKISGKNFGNVTLPAKFIGRESLGHKYVEERLHMHSDEKTLREDFSDIYYRYIYENDEEEAEKVYQKFEVVMRAVLKSVTKKPDIDDMREEFGRIGHVGHGQGCREIRRSDFDAPLPECLLDFAVQVEVAEALPVGAVEAVDAAQVQMVETARDDFAARLFQIEQEALSRRLFGRVALQLPRQLSLGKSVDAVWCRRQGGQERGDDADGLGVSRGFGADAPQQFKPTRHGAVPFAVDAAEKHDRLVWRTLERGRGGGDREGFRRRQIVFRCELADADASCGCEKTLVRKGVARTREKPSERVVVRRQDEMTMEEASTRRQSGEDRWVEIGE